MCPLLSFRHFVFCRQWLREDCFGTKGSADRTLPGKSFYRRCGNGRMSKSSHRHIYFYSVVCQFFNSFNQKILLCPSKEEEIYHQLRRLGASLDWSRACFTLDPVSLQSFVRLAKYCTTLSSSLSLSTFICTIKALRLSSFTLTMSSNINV